MVKNKVNNKKTGQKIGNIRKNRKLIQIKNKITKKNLILASQSPRRKELLEQAGVDFKIVPANIEEIIGAFERAEDYVMRLSREKALHVAQKYPGEWVIGADTTVVMGDAILEKPLSEDDARKMLETLSGRSHIVYTGFTICRKTDLAGRDSGIQAEEKLITSSVRTDVLFKTLTASEIDWYIGTGEPFDKAGSYAIQGLGTFMVRSINGSYSNVVGLPVCEVMEILAKEGIIEMT
ncbi:MAG: septum formation inhibitor Maf [Desulfamplus sp.]|nr:septum formation inhibitor Maf [Desulfamplus sp.]